jgi:predicted enzyme related to lactoylglutathione lyase
MAIRTSYAQGVPSWVDLATSDADGARAFYGALFGWDFEVNPDPATGHYTIASLGGQRVAGLFSKPAPDAPTLWMTYLAVDDAAKSVAVAQEHGASLLMGPMALGQPDGAELGTMAILVDPAGGTFAYWQAGSHTGAELVNVPGTVIWNDLNTTDLDGSVRFLTAVLGYGTAPYEQGWQGRRYVMLTVGADVVGGIADAPVGTPYWKVYFAVSDVDGTVQRAVSLGGTVETPAWDSPQGRTADLADPQAGRFTVIAVPPGA